MRINENEMQQIRAILEQTTRLTFPFIANKQKKEKMLRDERYRIENKIEKILMEYTQMRKEFEERKDEIWNSSVDISVDKFKSLPDKLQLNSFYFQEVMHEYVEEIINLLCEEE
ncbi:MAG: hypothetical protein K6F51_05055 [Acetatifactor sp.]|nr:hypothetical protein [Acetatifactor sp.]